MKNTTPNKTLNVSNPSGEKMKKQEELEPFNEEIQVCPKCHQVDAYKDDGHPCDPEYQEQRALSNEYYD